MTFHITIGMEVFWGLLGFLIWFTLPYLVNLKQFMTPQRRSNKWYVVLAVLMTLPTLLILLGLKLFIQVLTQIIHVFEVVSLKLAAWTFLNETNKS